MGRVTKSTLQEDRLWHEALGPVRGWGRLCPGEGLKSSEAGGRGRAGAVWESASGLWVAHLGGQCPGVPWQPCGEGIGRAREAGWGRSSWPGPRCLACPCSARLDLRLRAGAFCLLWRGCPLANLRMSLKFHGLPLSGGPSATALSCVHAVPRRVSRWQRLPRCHSSERASCSRQDRLAGPDSCWLGRRQIEFTSK